MASLGRSTKRVDRYGFFVEGSTRTSGSSRSSRSGLTGEDKEASRTAKWRKMLNQWEKYTTKKRHKLIRRVYKGIPDPVRGDAYLRLTDARWLKQVRHSYEKLCREPQEMDSVIRRDIDRTFPDHQLFSTPEGQERIFRVAHSYCVLHPEVGYCQGMNFLIGTLLIFLEEEDAFWVFVRLLEDLNMGGVYKNGFPLLKVHYYQIDRLMEIYLPRLHRHFKDMGIVPELFTTKWFITIFFSCFPFAESLHVLDLFMIEGILAVFRVGLAALKVLEDKLLGMAFEDLLPFLQSIPTENINFSKIHSTMKKMGIDAAELTVYELEHTVLNSLISKSKVKEAGVYQNPLLKAE